MIFIFELSGFLALFNLTKWKLSNRIVHEWEEIEIKEISHKVTSELLYIIVEQCTDEEIKIWIELLF